MKMCKHNLQRVLSFFLIFTLIIQIFSTIPIVAHAEEITPSFTYSYLSNGKWTRFNGRMEGSVNIDGLRIQNVGSKQYYLQYRTQNAGVSSFYSFVKSTDTAPAAYAGSSGKAMQKLQIQVYNSSGTKIVNDIVVMYRVKTAKSGWLSWVSNADPEYMKSAQSTYDLSGTLDSSSYYAGKGTENIIGIEIRVFSNVEPSETPSDANFDGVEVTPALSYMVGNENNWTTFNKKVIVNGGFDGLRIQTSPSKEYYLSYRTLNEGKSSYYQAVNSNGTDYAGLPRQKIQKLNIRAINNNGTAIKSGIVVMYRAYLDGKWLPWVSNADPEYMRSVQSKFQLGGTLDTAGSFAGKAGHNIEGIEIRVFEGKIPSSTIDNLPGKEAPPSLSYMVGSKNNWTPFSTRVETTMDGLKIQTDPSKEYYLNYRTLNVPMTSYYPYVSSTIDDYAGSAGKKIARLNIEVRRKSDNSKIDSGVVVMYRVKVGTNWLPWVSNAAPEWMRSVQAKYGITGVLDTQSSYAGKSDGSIISGVEIRIFEENSLFVHESDNGATKKISAPYINQLKKYKTACESISAVMALKKAKQNISPETFINVYLNKGSYESFDPNVCFGGNPYSSSGMGCYAPVIEKAVNKYLADVEADYVATKLYNKSLDYLCSTYVDKDIPVIVWATTDMKVPYNGRKIPYGNGYIQWIAPEHCLLLVGYDNNNYIFHDPQRQAYTYYAKEDVIRAYLGMGAQCVVITPHKRESGGDSSELPSGPEENPHVKPQEKKPDNKAPESVEADPVDLYSGSHTIHVDLLKLNGGKNLSVSANYNSSQLVKGSLGVGWYHSYEKTLLHSGKEIQLYDSPSTYYKFSDADGDGIYSCSTLSKKGYTLVTTADPNYTYVVDCNGDKTEYYDNTGKLTKIVDRNAFVTTISSTASLITIGDTTTGKHIYLEKAPDGKIVRVYDDASREVLLTYANDFLVSIKDVNGNKLTYSYDEKGRVASGVDRDIVCYFKNTYDSQGRVIRQVDGEGHTPTCFSYGNDGTRTVIDRNGCTSVRKFNSDGLLTSYTDENGNTKTYAYDNNGNIVSETDALGNSVKAVYNKFNKPTQITDKNGNTTFYQYDSVGNLLSVTYPQTGGTKAVEHYAYNDRNQVVIHSDLRGTITTYTYDNNGFLATKKVGEKRVLESTYTDGFLMTQKDARGITTTYTYNKIGLPAAMIKGPQNQMTYEYDLSGNLLKVTDSYGKSTSYTYDANYNRTAEIDANGNTTWYSYDGNMKLVTVTLPGGNTIQYEYDNEDRQITTIDQDGNTTTTEYDPAGRIVTKQDADKNIIVYELDAIGNIVKETNQLGAVTVRTYDAAGNVLSITDHYGNTIRHQYDKRSRLVKTINAMSGETTYQYSNAGDLLSITDPLGNIIRYTYDEYGNKLTETDARGNCTTYTYDGNNNLLSQKDALGNETTYVYNGYNYLVRKTNAKKQTTLYAFDAYGRKLASVDPRGNNRSYTYDAMGQLLTSKDAKGKISTTKTYNSLNLLESETNAVGNTTTYRYNNRGLLQSITDALGHQQKYWYDANGNVVKVLDSENGISKATYDVLGNITSLSGPHNGTTEYTYDVMGRLITETTTSGGTVKYGYNALSLKEQLTNARGQTRTYTYDKSGRITGYTSPEGKASYTYDANGNVLTATDQNGTITREYDALNRVIKYTDTLGNVIQYAYDANGNLTKITYPDNTCVNYSYDNDDNLQKVTDWANRETRYNYDPNANLLEIHRPDGSSLQNVYDDAQRIISTVDKNAAGEILVGYEYTYDELGRIASETHLAENVKYEYGYDSLSRVVLRDCINLTDNTSFIERYTYDSAGNIVACKLNTGVSNFFYDQNNRITSYNRKSVTYDADGNMVSAFLNGSEMTLTYDSANRLISAGGNAYTYDVEDVRVRNLCGGSESTYTYNTNGKLSQLLVKTTDGVVTKYVYGVGLIGEETGGSFYTYHFDYRGSTSAITDISGNVTDTFTYDTYGNLLSKTGSTPAIFLYNGRDGVITDTNGLVYMRARYYSPELKRFVNADIIAGSISNAITLNRYAYANGNPVTNIDPLGMSAERGNKEKRMDYINAYMETTDNPLYNLLKLWKVNFTRNKSYLIKETSYLGGGFRVSLNASVTFEIPLDADMNTDYSLNSGFSTHEANILDLTLPWTDIEAQFGIYVDEEKLAIGTSSSVSNESWTYQNKFQIGVYSEAGATSVTYRPVDKYLPTVTVSLDSEIYHFAKGIVAAATVACMYAPQAVAIAAPTMLQFIEMLGSQKAGSV